MFIMAASQRRTGDTAPPATVPRALGRAAEPGRANQAVPARDQAGAARPRAQGFCNLQGNASHAYVSADGARWFTSRVMRAKWV